MSWSETLFLKTIIDGNKKLVASDNLYCYVVSNVIDVPANNTMVVPNKIKFKTDGSVNLVFLLNSSSAANPQYANLTIYKNNQYFNNYIDINAEQTVFLDVKKGDEFYFELKNTASSNAVVSLNSMYIKASLIDGSGVDIIEI